MKIIHTKLWIVIWIILHATTSFCQVDSGHQEDVVYGYKDGMALVMDVYSPPDNSNSTGIILVMGGGMASNPLWSHAAGTREDVQTLVNAGYTIFAAAHSSQPKYTADEIRNDIPRAVRFIRYHADRFGINPGNIGILGYSSGGHVCLMAATSPPIEKLKSEDPVDRVSSTVQAAVAYFPSTDLLNFGKKNTTILEYFNSTGFYLDAAFDFQRWDTVSHRFERVEKPESVKEFYKKNSPINFITGAVPPVLLIHGDQDKLVPLQQSELFFKKLKEQKLPGKLLVMKGKGHGWNTPVENEYDEVLEWYGKYLLSK